MNWQAIAVLVTLLLAFGGGLIAVIKWLLSELLRENQRHIDQRFSALEAQIEEKMLRIREVENALSDFKIEVARQYVHREDWIRVEGGRDITIRSIHEKLDQLREALNAAVHQH